MHCEYYKENLALSSDIILPDEARAGLETHLKNCPVCRARQADYLALRNELSNLQVPEMSADFMQSLRIKVAEQANMPYSPSVFGLSTPVREWLQFKLMPYAVGTFATIFFAFALLGSLQPGRNTAIVEDQGTKTSPRHVHTYDNVDFPGDDPPLTQADYAALRVPVSGESPSLNPSGALVALTKSIARGQIKDEEVVIVADVFGDGVARITEVVEAPRNNKSLEDLTHALEKDPDYAPFVPASIDKRSDIVRVVLRIQQVQVIRQIRRSRTRAS